MLSGLSAPVAPPLSDRPEKGPIARYWYLRNFKPFATLTDEEVEMLNIRSCMIRLKKGEFLYLPQDDQPSLYFLKRGLIRIGHYTEDGKEVVVDILQPSEIFGEVFREHLPPAEAQPIREFAQSYADETYICGIYTKDFEALLNVKPSLGVTLLKNMNGRIHKLERKLESLAYKDVRLRVVELLVQLAEPAETGYVIPHGLSHQDLADLAAASRQTVTKILTELKDKGLLDYNRKGFFLPNPQALLSSSAAA